MTKLSQLIYHLYDTPLYADPEISGLSLDSRQVKPGDLFFACKGTQLDGRQFINDAIKNGAHAVLADVDTQSTHVQTEHQVPILPVDHLAEPIGDIRKILWQSCKKIKNYWRDGHEWQNFLYVFFGTSARAMQYSLWNYWNIRQWNLWRN